MESAEVTGYIAVASNQYGMALNRNEEEAIEWILGLLEMNQMYMWTVLHFYFNLSVK
jgi:hypothetical protein